MMFRVIIEKILLHAKYYNQGQIYVPMFADGPSETDIFYTSFNRQVGSSQRLVKDAKLLWVTNL